MREHMGGQPSHTAPTASPSLTLVALQAALAAAGGAVRGCPVGWSGNARPSGGLHAHACMRGRAGPLAAHRQGSAGWSGRRVRCGEQCGVQDSWQRGPPGGQTEVEGATGMGGLPVVGIDQEVDAAVATHQLLLQVAPRGQQVAAAAGVQQGRGGSAVIVAVIVALGGAAGASAAGAIEGKPPKHAAAAGPPVQRRRKHGRQQQAAAAMDSSTHCDPRPVPRSRRGLCRCSGQEQHSGREECLVHGCSLRVCGAVGSVGLQLAAVSCWTAAAGCQASPARDSWQAPSLSSLGLRC